MTPLPQRMIEDMRIRNLSPRTITCYVRQVARFAEHFGRSPFRLGPEEIRACQHYLVDERRVSESRLVQTVAALRFLYQVSRGGLKRYPITPHPPDSASTVASNPHSRLARGSVHQKDFIDWATFLDLRKELLAVGTDVGSGLGS